MDKRKFLEECIELKVRRRERIIIILPMGLFLLVTLPLISESWISYLGIAAFILLIFSPFLIYYTIKIRNIIKYFPEYEYFEVTLDKLESSIYGRACFKIDIMYDKKRSTYETRPFFTTQFMNLIYLNLTDYMNQNVLIAFNPILKEVVLVKKI